MSTRSTLACIISEQAHFCLYHEMHDDCIHLEITDTSGSYSSLNIIMPKWMADSLANIFKRAKMEP